MKFEIDTPADTAEVLKAWGAAAEAERARIEASPEFIAGAERIRASLVKHMEGKPFTKANLIEAAKLAVYGEITIELDEATNRVDVFVPWPIGEVA